MQESAVLRLAMNFTSRLAEEFLVYMTVSSLFQKNISPD